MTTIRLGLCCTFRDAPIKFPTTTATSLSRLPRSDALQKLARLADANADALLHALHFCADHNIGAFRINSQILPLKTHPLHRYSLADLPDGQLIEQKFRLCGAFARDQNLRTSFHPDQFVVLNSPRPQVVTSSLLELEYQAEVADWVHADVINIHAGGVFNDKPQALKSFSKNLARLSDRARRLLTVENDDRSYSPADLLPLCRSESLPLVYDVHHHRCLPDSLSISDATAQALDTWNREPLFHISSPLNGWTGAHPQRHHDFIDPADWPPSWHTLRATIDIEAKAKEAAVLKLQSDLTTLL